jgi:hypothetical protein
MQVLLKDSIKIVFTALFTSALPSNGINAITFSLKNGPNSLLILGSKSPFFFFTVLLRCRGNNFIIGFEIAVAVVVGFFVLIVEFYEARDTNPKSVPFASDVGIRNSFETVWIWGRLQRSSYLPLKMQLCWSIHGFREACEPDSNSTK